MPAYVATRQLAKYGYFILVVIILSRRLEADFFNEKSDILSAFPDKDTQLSGKCENIQNYAEMVCVAVEN